MSDNGNKPNEGTNRLAEIEARIKELEPKKEESPLIRKELAELYNEKIKLTTKPEENKDYKIAEIWIREGQIMLDASPDFWGDKLRARGLLLYCDDIVKAYELPKQKIVLPKHGIMDFVRKKRF